MEKTKSIQDGFPKLFIISSQKLDEKLDQQNYNILFVYHNIFIV